MGRDNPDRALLAAALAGDLRDVPVAANPIAQAWGMVLHRVREGEVSLGYTIDERFVQGAGAVQGGIVAGMLDFGLAFAALTRVGAGESVATVSLNVNFLRAARPGRFRVEAGLERMGRTMAFARAELFQEDGQCVASASSPIAVIRTPAAPGSQSSSAA